MDAWFVFIIIQVLDLLHCTIIMSNAVTCCRSLPLPVLACWPLPTTLSALHMHNWAGGCKNSQAARRW